ncbi:porin [Vibrio sp.]|uniref:porin n=1 Tax=Vibrio sp. TaxID=678 RepID=UPI003AA82FD7
MKKSLLALAVSAAAFTGAASAAEIYSSETTSVKLSGEVDAYIMTGDVKVDGEEKQKSDPDASIWGKTQFDVDYKLNDSNKAFLSFEIEGDGDDGAVFDDLYLGFTNDTFGTFTVGEAGDSFDNLEKTDITNEGLYAGTIESVDSSNAVRWQKAFGGLALSADIQTDTDSSNNVYAASADWSITDAFTVGTGYSTDGEDAYTAALSASAQLGGLYLAASASKYENFGGDFKFTGNTDRTVLAAITEGNTYGFAAAYQMNDTRFYGTYALVDDDTDAKFNAYTVGVDHAIIDNVLVFAEYSGVSGDEASGSDVTGNLFLLGTYFTF